MQSELSDRQAALQTIAGKTASVVVGDPVQLRARSALLANLGIEAVVADGTSAEASHQPRQLPCGLWQFRPAVALPRTRHRWSLLPARRLTAAQLLATASAFQPQLLAIDVAKMSVRAWQDCERLVQEIAAAVKNRQAALLSIREAAAKLTSQRAVKPQRSILRRAA